MRNDNGIKIVAVCAALIAAAAPLQAQITTTSTTTSSTTVKSSVEQPVMISAEARHAFEVSMQANPLGPTLTDPPLAQLSWGALMGASSYTILRSAAIGGPYVAIPVRDALNYRARYLPGKPFYFRVVALGSKGAVLDTTSAIAVSTAPIDPDPMSSALANGVNLTCNAIVPSGFALTWAKPNGADDARVELLLIQGYSTNVGNSVQSGTSYSQTGLPPGHYKVTVALNYTLNDYPVAGQSTSVPTGRRDSRPVTAPVTTAGPCS